MLQAKFFGAQTLLYCCALTTDSAESYLNQALSTYEGLYGSGHAKTLEVKDELARLMIRTDRVEVSEFCSSVTFNSCVS